MNGFPGSRLRGRLRSDAPAPIGLKPGIWYDVFGGEAGRSAASGTVLLRPEDAPPGDAASYIPVGRHLVELGRTDGSRILTDRHEQRWLAALVAEPPESPGATRLRFVCQDGSYRFAPGVASCTLDPLSDGELLTMLEVQTRNGRPPSGVRTEARVKPAFAWGYRMLDPEAWYLVDPRWTTDRALVLVTVEGDRVVDAAHFEAQTFLD